MESAETPGRPLDAMCGDIVGRYHASLQRSLPRIRDELTALSGAASTLRLEVMRQAFAELADQISAHLVKEEQLLFPAVRALAAADREGSGRPSLPFVTVLYPIRMMEAEHVRIETAMDRLRELSREVAEPDSLSHGWRLCLADLALLAADLREHHRTENEELFPRALELERRLT